MNLYRQTLIRFLALLAFPIMLYIGFILTMLERKGLNGKGFRGQKIKLAIDETL